VPNTTTTLPPPLDCVFKGNLTVECGTFFYSLRTLGGAESSVLYQPLEDGSILLVQVEDGGLPARVLFDGRACELNATGYTSALLLANHTCVGFTQLPSLSPAQWILQQDEPQLLSVGLTDTNSNNLLSVNVVCNISAVSTSILYALQISDSEISVYLEHCSSCAEGCPIVPVKCDPLRKDFQLSCGSINFDLHTLQGETTFAFAFASNETIGNKTLDDVYFFDLVAGLGQTNDITGYTCDLGNPDDDDEAGLYFLAHTNSTTSTTCYPIVKLPFLATYNFSLWTGITRQYLQLYYPATTTAGQSLTVNIVCNPRQTYANVYQGGHDFDGNLLFYLNHDSTCAGFVNPAGL